MQKQVPLWLSSIIIIVVLVLSAFVIVRLHINTDVQESEDKNMETIQPAYVAMPSRPSQYLSKEQKDQLVTEVSDLFLNSKEIIFRYRGSKEPKMLDDIVITDRSVLKLFSENFNFDSEVSYAPGVPGAPVYMYFRFMPSGRALFFDLNIAERIIHISYPEIDINYCGYVNHNFLLFCQYYFDEIIDQYGEFNWVDKTRLYTYPKNQNVYIEEKLANFSHVVSPYSLTNDQ